MVCRTLLILFLRLHNHQPVYASNPSSAQTISQYSEVVNSDEQYAVTNNRLLPKVDTSCLKHRGRGTGSVVETAGCETIREVCRGPVSLIQDFNNSRSHLLVDNMDNVSKTIPENPLESLTAYQDKKITDIVQNVVSTLFKTLTESIQQTSSLADQTLASIVNKENSNDAAGLPHKAPTILSVQDYQSKDAAPAKLTNGKPYTKMLVGLCNERIEQTNSSEIRQHQATSLPMSNASSTLQHSNLNQKQYGSYEKVQSKQQQQILTENKLRSEPGPPPASSRSNCSYEGQPRLRPNVRMSNKQYNIIDLIYRTRKQDSLRINQPNSPQNRPPKTLQYRSPKSPQNRPPDLLEDSPPSPALSDCDNDLMEKARTGESVCLLELHPNTGSYSSTFNNGVINIVSHESHSRNTENQNHYSCKKFSVVLKETDRGSRMSPGSKGKRRRKIIPYTTEEVRNLLTGVSKMGKFWKQILCSYKFHPARTSVDLKDKYKRIMVRFTRS